ncbi:MAG: GNAT family N-acetyltransferase [Flavobacteriaceae bacterium]|nr:GNAT family N-acetyltransferase [Flavobacteriaceae bacterium]
MENIEYRKSPLRRTLETVDLKLRALEQSDIDYLFSTENDESYWETSCTREPISAEFLRKYIENSNLGIYESKQLRLIIVDKKTEKPIGLISLHSFEPVSKKAAVGILISESSRRKGYASQALECLIEYSMVNLMLSQLYAEIIFDNSASKRIFEKNKFKKTAELKDWILFRNKYKNMCIYQLLAKDYG